MAFTGVTNAHGPSPQPTACRSPTCSLMTATGSNQALGKVETYLAKSLLSTIGILSDDFNWGAWSQFFHGAVIKGEILSRFASRAYLSFGQKQKRRRSKKETLNRKTVERRLFQAESLSGKRLIAVALLKVKIGGSNLGKTLASANAFKWMDIFHSGHDTQEGKYILPPSRLLLRHKIVDELK